MKRYLKIAIAALMIFSLSIAPNAVILSAPLSADAVSAETVSIQKAEPVKAAPKTESVQENKTVTINEKTVEKLQDKNDTFYEPEEESITVLEDSSAFVNDAVSVFFKDGTAEDEKQAVVDSVNGEFAGEIGFMNQYEIKIQHSEFDKIENICNSLMENDCVEFASCIITNSYEPDYVPDDPWNGYPNWNENANSGYSRYSNWWIKAIDADKAWDYEEKFSNIKIGIVDSGFDTEHEELQGKITFPSKFYEKHNAPDDHGTHVSGIIAADRDNGKGISGIVQNCQLVCVDWHANKEQGQKWISEVRIMSGFIAAVRAGAKVVNFSLGSSGTITNGTTDRYKFVKDAEAKYTSYIMAKLLQHGYDFICCQSAGNGVDMKNGDSFAVDASNNGTFCTITEKNAVKFVIGVKPKDILDRIIIVSAAKFDGYNKYSHSTFSNGGSQVSISAPGSSIYSTIYDPEDEDRDYGYMSGTSMAAPIVTAVTSLVWSVNQNFTGAQVKHFVCDVENTKYMVEDNDDETHLPTGSIPLVNAQLAVEAALRANGDTGYLEGDIDTPDSDDDENISVEVVNNNSGEVYRLFTGENGTLSARLPEGDYIIRAVDGVEWNEGFTVTKDEVTTLDTLATGKTGLNTEKLVGALSQLAETVAE